MSLVYKQAVMLHQSWVQLCVVFVTPFWNSLSAMPSVLPSKATPGLEPLKSSCTTTTLLVLGQN